MTASATALPDSPAAISSFSGPWATALAWSAAAYGIVQFRYQAERSATVLPVAVQLPGPAGLLLQLNLSLRDDQPIGAVALRWVVGAFV